MKVQVSMDNALLKRVDQYADDNYMSRSALVTLALTQFLNSQEVKIALKDIAICTRKIADTGAVDSETQQKLFDLERFCRMFVGA